tara:strand:+ start:1139 stop:1435 length:297 start_codon:yes stop_codon:yes gene_type:complete
MIQIKKSQILGNPDIKQNKYWIVRIEDDLHCGALEGEISETVMEGPFSSPEEAMETIIVSYHSHANVVYTIRKSLKKPKDFRKTYMLYENLQKTERFP